MTFSSARFRFFKFENPITTQNIDIRLLLNSFTYYQLPMHTSTLRNNNMFVETGPIIKGEIFTDEVCFLQYKNSQGFSPYAKVKLLIDTGSNISGIDGKIIKGLSLDRYEDHSEVNGVGGIHSLSRFRCILFLNIFGMKGLPLDILEGDYSCSPYDGIIGRDVLQFCSFEYHGPTNSFQLKALNF
jgi:hypothetical protein